GPAVRTHCRATPNPPPEDTTAAHTDLQDRYTTIHALVPATRAVVRNKGFRPETAVAACLAAGYSKAQLLEVVGHVGLKVLANYTHALTGAPLDEAFQPQQWDAPELEVA